MSLQIVACTDGQYAILDHDLQNTIFRGTLQECKDEMASLQPSQPDLVALWGE